MLACFNKNNVVRICFIHTSLLWYFATMLFRKYSWKWLLLDHLNYSPAYRACSPDLSGSWSSPFLKVARPKSVNLHVHLLSITQFELFKFPWITRGLLWMYSNPYKTGNVIDFLSVTRQGLQSRHTSLQKITLFSCFFFLKTNDSLMSNNATLKWVFADRFIFAQVPFTTKLFVQSVCGCTILKRQFLILT